MFPPEEVTASGSTEGFTGCSSSTWIEGDALWSGEIVGGNASKTEIELSKDAFSRILNRVKPQI